MGHSSERSVLLIAALLHSIGEVARRAGLMKEKEVDWMRKWLKEYERLWQCLEVEEGLYRVLEGYYKRDESDLLTRILIYASQISGGVAGTPDADPLHYMLSPFAVLNGTRGQFYQLPIKPLDVATSGFPEKLVKARDLRSDYRRLWEAFEKEFKALSGSNWNANHLNAFASTLLSLLFKYLWAVPSSAYGTEPVISLYHQLKTTSAIALILYDWYQEAPEQREQWIQNGTSRTIAQHHPFLLVVGNVSGIQAFIYNIYQSKAKKALKGRSFYLQLLTNVIAHEILREVGGFSGQVLSMAGGRFYLLLPNIGTVREKVETYRSNLHEWLWREHKNTLYVSIDWIPFGFAHDRDSKESLLFLEEEDRKLLGCDQCAFNHLWELVRKRLHIRKQERWKELLESHFDAFFVCSEEGGRIGDKQICAVTGSLASLEEMGVLKEDGDVFVLKNVFAQIALGGALTKARYIVFTPLEEETIGGAAHIHIHETRVTVCERLFHRLPENALVLKVNDTAFLEYSLQPGVTYGFLLYGGNHHPLVSDDTPATFDHLAVVEQGNMLFPLEEIPSDEGEPEVKKWCIELGKDQKTTYLAVLRCDVDNLGMLFSDRIPAQYQSFAFFSTLSFMLEWFFAGYLNTFQAENPFYRKHLLIVYSGGDDLFVIGRWDVVLHFFTHFRKAFQRFVCDREDITLSAGLFLMKPRFPIHRAAEIAGEMEKKAKQYPGKNAITLFDVPVSYKEWQWLMGLIPSLCEFNSGLLHRFNAYYFKALTRGEPQDGEKPSSVYLHFLIHLAYTTGRNYENELRKELTELNRYYWEGIELNGDKVNVDRVFVLIAVAIQCAILFKRMDKKAEENELKFA